MYHFLYFFGAFLRKNDKNCVYVANRNKIVCIKHVKLFYLILMGILQKRYA